MALTANIDDRRNAGRRGAMVPVAIVAGWCGQVTLARHHLPVDAGFVFFDLVGGNFVGRHVLLVGVTESASISDFQRMNRGARIIGRSDRMRQMTTGAGRDFWICLLFKSLAVN